MRFRRWRESGVSKIDKKEAAVSGRLPFCPNGPNDQRE